MLQKIINAMKSSASNDDDDARRTYERREQDQCIAIIDGVGFPVQNWSKGGLLLSGDDRTFGIDDIKNIIMRFKLTDRVVDVQHKAQVIRKGRDKFVLQFQPLTQNVENQFNNIVDDYVAQEFANSQA